MTPFANLIPSIPDKMDLLYTIPQEARCQSKMQQ